MNDCSKFFCTGVNGDICNFTCQIHWPSYNTTLRPRSCSVLLKRFNSIIEKNYIIKEYYKHKYVIKTKRRRSDPVLWQKPLHQQKCQRGKVTTQTTPQKSSIKQQLRTDLGRSVGVTTDTQLVWLTGLRAHLPTQRFTKENANCSKSKFKCMEKKQFYVKKLEFKKKMTV